MASGLGGRAWEPNFEWGVVSYQGSSFHALNCITCEGQRSPVHPDQKTANEFGRPVSKGKRRASTADAALAHYRAKSLVIIR